LFVVHITANNTRSGQRACVRRRRVKAGARVARHRADEWDVSERTISAAMKILGDHGFLKLENRRYHVA
jgi:hypothetical protein